MELTYVGGPKTFRGRWDPVPLGLVRWWRWPHRNTFLRHLSYHTKFCRFRSNRLGADRECPQKYGVRDTGVTIPPTRSCRTCYQHKFRGCRSNHFGVHRSPKNVGDAVAPPPLGLHMGRGWSHRNTPLRHIHYQANFVAFGQTVWA